MRIEHKIYELRKKAGLSQEELGYQLHVSRQTVSKWETGQSLPELDKVSALCALFQISADELISEEAELDSKKVSDETYEKESAELSGKSYDETKKTVHSSASVKKHLIIGLSLFLVMILLIALLNEFAVSSNIQVIFVLPLFFISVTFLTLACWSLIHRLKTRRK